MRRTALALIAATMAATAGRAAADDDTRPTSATIAPPAGWVPPPARTLRMPAPFGWWKKKKACGKGHRLRTTNMARYDPAWSVAYLCTDGTRDDGFHVVLDAQGRVVEEGVVVRGQSEGLRRSYGDGVLSREQSWKAGVRDGEDRTYSAGRLIEIATFRDGKRDGHAWRRTYIGASQQVTVEGYVVDGERHGTWLATYTDGSIIARIDYDHGRIVGAPRWWYPDGRVWARGAVDGDVVTWTRDTGPGRYQVELVCDGDRRRSVKVWEHGALVLDGCPDPEPSCTKVTDANRELMTWNYPLECDRAALLEPRVWPVLAKN